jgi:hypothetical protein
MTKQRMVSSTFVLHYADGSPKLVINDHLHALEVEVVCYGVNGRIADAWYGTPDELITMLDRIGKSRLEPKA